MSCSTRRTAAAAICRLAVVLGMSACSAPAHTVPEPAPTPPPAQTDNTLRIDLWVEAPLARVWRAWTEETELQAWLAESAHVQLHVGGPYELFWEQNHPERNSTLGCVLTVVQPLQRLAFTWKGPVQFAELMNAGEPPPTHVSVVFTPDGARTSVHLEHAGWGQGEAWQAARVWQENAWRRALGQLQTRLAEGK